VIEYLAKTFGAEAMRTFYASRGWEVNWPLAQVPANNMALQKMVDEIKEFQSVGPDPEQEPPTDAPPQEDSGSDLPENIAEYVISVPRKGMKRADYLANPDTIGSLYAAMKGGDNEAQKRLWGMAKNYTPESWVGNDGVKRAPSQADVDCRIGLDLFLEWTQNKESDDGPSEGSMNSYDERDLNP
jgi:hypothetical protein